MVKSLPKKLTKHFKEVIVLVDTANGLIQFIHGVREKKFHIIAGIACTRKLIDGRSVAQLHKRGQQLYLSGFKISCLYILVLF
jgi:hypothetical protein